MEGKKRARIIALANEKGGTGKTTTTCNLSAGLRRAGYKTLMIDLDAQCSLSKSLLALDEAHSIMLPMAGIEPIENVIQADNLAQGDIISSIRTLTTVDILLDEAEKMFALRDALEPILERYDYILLDCPPALSTLTINALVASTEVIIPTEAKTFAFKGVEEILKTIQTVRKRYNPNLKIGGILITRYDGRTVLAREMLDVFRQKAEEAGTKVYSTPIRENIAIAESQAYLTDIFAGSPKSNGAKDYKALVDEVIADGEKQDNADEQ